jgi:signal transduction histidine kinase/CheY-like chemotaxis protein
VTDRLDPEECFLVAAPTGRDAALTCQLIERAGMHARACAALPELCEVLARDGAAGLLIAQEVLTARGVACLTEALARQEAWSDLPVLLFMRADAATARPPSLDLLEPLGNVTLLDRPIRPVTMQSAARSALRTRRRQYAARAELRGQQDAVRQRDQFLAMLGHELRNPLSAIVLASERMDQAENGQAARYRDTLRRQTANLSRLVDDLLDVSRVTSGKIVLARRAVDLGDLVARCLQISHAGSEGQRLRLAYRPPTRPVAVDGDPVRLEQIVVNLVNNAIKYTPVGGSIECEVAADGDDGVLRVIDSGCGIAPDMLPRVFDLFTQAHATLDRAQGGMGIGLTLVRRLVELHGGTVWVDSAGVGRGSVFTVRLPLAAEALARPESDATPPAPIAAEPGAAPQDVLVVEDNADSRELLVELLANVGHRVEAAVDGPSAVHAALTHPPRVALIDIGLPGLDGYTVARKVRAALGESVYLIAMTGYGQPEDRRRAVEAGFDLHLTKPVDMRALCHLLAQRELPRTRST